jgi:tight adherence protein C
MPAAIDFTSWLPLAIFGACSTTVWLLLSHQFGRSRSVEYRLQYLHRVGIDDGPGRLAPKPKPSVVSRWWRSASPQLAKPLQPRNPKEAGKLRMRLSHAGFRSDAAPSLFLAMKVLCLTLGLLGGGGTVFFTMGLNSASVTRAAVVALLVLFAPDVILYLLARRRKLSIFLGLPDAIDLMVVSVEAGLGLDQAMRRVADEMRQSFPVVASEFNQANIQLQMGVNRSQVLRELALRNGEDDLNGFCSVLIQSAKFGSGVGPALRVHSDAMRVRRRQIAEEKAAKCAVQLIFPLVLFIFPGIFVVLVGPAAVSIIRNLLPAMGG